MTLSLIVSTRPCSRKRILCLNRSLYLWPKTNSCLRNSLTMLSQKYIYHPSQSKFSQDTIKMSKWCNTKREFKLNQRHNTKTITGNLIRRSHRSLRYWTMANHQSARPQAHIRRSARLGVTQTNIRLNKLLICHKSVENSDESPAIKEFRLIPITVSKCSVKSGNRLSSPILTCVLSQR